MEIILPNWYVLRIENGSVINMLLTYMREKRVGDDGQRNTKFKSCRKESGFNLLCTAKRWTLSNLDSKTCRECQILGD